MRILLTAPPGIGHVLPLVPLAWAAELAGHEALFASTGPALAMAIHSGLRCAEVCGTDIADTYRRTADHVQFPRPLTRSEAQLVLAGWSKYAEPRRAPVRSAAERLLSGTVGLTAAVGERMIDGLVGLIHRWSPDVVVATGQMPAGILAAEVTRVPLVLHRSGVAGPVPAAALASMSGARARYGLPDGEVIPTAVVDSCPDSLRPTGSDAGVPLRWTSYTGGGVLPSWALSAPARPRVCVMAGSSLPARTEDLLFGQLVARLGRRDVEVVVSTGGADLSRWSPLPSNVRVATWFPLPAVLPTCVALIHHGSTSSTFAALASGVPQLVLPRSLEQPMNAASVVERGVGDACALLPETVDEVGSALDRVLDDDVLRSAAREVAEEIAALPAPSHVLNRLSEFVP
ncbi:nucleotide disphospho-sugar-binding domain-containing protein [Actinoalloteichus caeruleus]|uniref:nucleotide disphospho-sugar-binding domain-containing protein n=1 Tax=Actinoalloteichus cyanogriseus TaxID=2893586 RepID=UPI003BB897D7